jgi:hypothetical protein
MTAKQRVLRKYPGANSYRWSDCWSVYRPLAGGNLYLGSGKTAAQAWHEAWVAVRRSIDQARVEAMISTAFR